MSKSRQVNSRYLSPALTDGGFSSPNQCFSPLHRKSAAARTDPRKPRDDNSPAGGGGPKGLIWPSSSTAGKKVDATLADHLGNERYRDQCQRRESDRLLVYKKTTDSKENQQPKPKMGGSMRYSGKLDFLRKSNSRNSASSSESIHLIPGRLSVDENALNGRRGLDSYAESIESGTSECSDLNSGSMEFDSSSIGKTSSFSSSLSSRKQGREVPSKYFHDSKSRPSRGTKDSYPNSSDNSPILRRFSIKNGTKRADLSTGYGSSTSQWALSPGRSSSSSFPGLTEKKGKTFSFSSLKPPTSPSKSKRVEKFLNMGLDLFKSRKSSSPSSLLSSTTGNVEIAHRLRILHNGLMQWRYANARANVVNESMARKAESNLVCAWDTLQTLRLSVVQKRLHLQKENLGMKLNYILHFQMRPLQSWGEMERQHVSALSRTISSLHSVVCRVPLVDGAKLDPQSASIVIQHSSDLTASMKSMLSTLSPSIKGTSFLLAELAEVVAQEKSIIMECVELCKIISVLEIQERSLKGQIVQLRSEIAREAPVVAGRQDKNYTLVSY